MYKNILLIDDNAVDNFINSTFIKNCKLSKELHIFQSPRAALSFLKSDEKDLAEMTGVIFLDIDMPEMNGFKFLEEFSLLPRAIHKAYNIIILTSSIHRDDELSATAHPLVSQYIVKPLTSHFLIEMKSKMN